MPAQEALTPLFDLAEAPPAFLVGRTPARRSPVRARWLVAHNMGLIGWAARKYPALWRTLGEERARDAAVDALLRAALTWSLERQVKFSTYACTCLYRGLLSAMRDLARSRRVVVVAAGGSEELDGLQTRRGAETRREVEKHEAARLVGNMLALLPRRLARLLRRRYLEGWKLAEMAAREGVTGERIRQLLLRGERLLVGVRRLVCPKGI